MVYRKQPGAQCHQDGWDGHYLSETPIFSSQILIPPHVAINVMESVRFLGTTRNLRWEMHPSNVIKQAHQKISFLRILQKMNISSKVCAQFYRVTIESVFTSPITVWYPASSAHIKHRLKCIACTTSQFTGQEQEPVSVWHHHSVWCQSQEEG